MSDTLAAKSGSEFSEQEKQDLAASLATSTSSLLQASEDLFTRTLDRHTRSKFYQWKPVGPQAASIPQTHGNLDKLDVIPAIVQTPAYDEDGAEELLPKQLLSEKLLALPILDEAAPWSSVDDAIKSIAAEFGPILPAPSVNWTDRTSDRTMSLVAFQGLGAHRLEPVDNDPEGAAWVVDLAWMCAYPVRDGLEPYGAAAYFGADRALQRVYTPHNDRTHRPGDASWEHAKWSWRCSLFTAVTVADHLGGTHYLASNALITLAREHLPADHPIRRLLKPFGFGAVNINVGAVYTLSPQNGMAHRIFGFTYPGLVRLLVRGIETERFETFPEVMASKRVAGLGDAYPYATDGLELYAILQTYVEDYLAAFYTGESVIEDPAVRAWWLGFLDFAPNCGLGPLNRSRQVIDLLTQLMFIVTGFHGQVGTLAPYLLDPSFMGPKIRAGTEVSDIQSSVQMLDLTTLTQLEQPAMIGDYTHLFLDEEKPQVVGAFERYQQALVQLAKAIEDRNTRREQPFQTFNPRFLKVSVST